MIVVLFFWLFLQYCFGSTVQHTWASASRFFGSSDQNNMGSAKKWTRVRTYGSTSTVEPSIRSKGFSSSGLTEIHQNLPPYCNVIYSTVEMRREDHSFKNWFIMVQVALLPLRRRCFGFCRNNSKLVDKSLQKLAAKQNGCNLVPGSGSQLESGCAWNSDWIPLPQTKPRFNAVNSGSLPCLLRLDAASGESLKTSLSNCALARWSIAGSPISLWSYWTT